MTRERLMVVNDFYPDPDSVRAQALRMSYERLPDLTGWRTWPYRHPDTRRALVRAIGPAARAWEFDPDDLHGGNGSFFIALSDGPRSERVGVHYDLPRSHLIVVVYLTPGAPAASGTSLWRHRSTGLHAAPTHADACRMGRTILDLEAALEQASSRPRSWEELDRVGNLYNRAVIYRSALLHSATRHFGTTVRNGRIYQTFRLTSARAV